MGLQVYSPIDPNIYMMDLYADQKLDLNFYFIVDSWLTPFFKAKIKTLKETQRMSLALIVQSLISQYIQYTIPEYLVHLKFSHWGLRNDYNDLLKETKNIEEWRGGSFIR